MIVDLLTGSSQNRNKQNGPLSVNAQNLASWSRERKQVAVLQQELLQKEFEAREAREKAAHALDREIKERAHALDLEIKEKQLKLLDRKLKLNDMKLLLSEKELEKK